MVGRSGPLVLTPLSGIPLIDAGDDLATVILVALQDNRINVEDGDVLVLAQKIVSKSEARWVELETIRASAEAQVLAERAEKDPRIVELILRESSQILRVRPGLIIAEHRLGFVCANAGIDHSNVGPTLDDRSERVLLLPENPDASAARLRRALEDRLGRRLGVLIVDSHGRSWRLGTVGMTVGLSGIPGVQDLRGWADLFGRILQITQVGVADELASAASLVMGQAAEGTPIVHARGFPYPLREGELGELIRPKEEDLFR